MLPKRNDDTPTMAAEDVARYCDASQFRGPWLFGTLDGGSGFSTNHNVRTPGRRVLIVEDDSELREALAGSLSRSGHDIDAVACGKDALAAVKARPYGLAIIDLGLPDIDGMTLIRSWQEQAGHDFPVLVITALAALDDRLAALEAGAADYLTKPFSLTELEARVSVLLKECKTTPAQPIRVGHLDITPGDPRILIRGEPVFVSGQELALLERLAHRLGHVVRTADLANHLARGGEPLTEAAVAVNVHRLRARLGQAGVRIRTLRGFGYLLELANDVARDS